MVYQLLNDNGLEAYYQYEDNPGISQNKRKNNAFDYLDDKQLVAKLISFKEGEIEKVSFQLPQIHCSSCLYLLENISKIDKGILKSRVNFVKKEITITYLSTKTNLRLVVELLARIGYTPKINYDRLDTPINSHSYDKRIIYQLGLAGFAFGNIMLLSFTEYFGYKNASFLLSIGYINIVLATPVLMYSGVDYLKSAWKGILIKNINIDLPIAMGMLTLYFRSLYEIFSKTGEGYLDSFAGFIFFLLIGKWFQSFTYKALDFDRSYKSYFPISATIKNGSEWITKSIDNLKPGDLIRVRNQEIIPVDSILQKGIAQLDYSFVTGEADIISKSKGAQIFAGAKHQGEHIELKTTKKVDHSYLTQLWNDDTFKQRALSQSSKMIAGISKYFTFIVIIIAILTMIFWLTKAPSQAFNTFTSVLIVACPCALALAIPFTYGNILRLLSEQGFYLRNVSTIEDIQDINHIIFDKTGTITDNNKINIFYKGLDLSTAQKTVIKSACTHSSHPLSKAIVTHFKDIPTIDIDRYEEYIGQGFTAQLNDQKLKIGSSTYILDNTIKESGVFIEINGTFIGKFTFKHSLRDNIENIIEGLKKDFKISVLSGDSDNEKNRMIHLFGKETNIHFNQSPQDKLEKIKSLQAKGEKVMMIGDGLNDAGALKQSNVGIVISDESNHFTPACDGILDANKYATLLSLITYIRFAKKIIFGAFSLALVYNCIGLYFAISGQLSPVIAAILMPLSSITVIIYGVLSSLVSYRILTNN